jgi:hypothetical protein
MRFKFIDRPIAYTGKELRSRWIEERFGLKGNSVVSFPGSCCVRGHDLVDLEDLAAGKTVEGDRMLHFIAEILGVDLPGIVFAQRLLCVIAKNVIEVGIGKQVLRRDGDDLYVGEGKLSVSVATVSSVSGLIHLGLNITAEGVPVKAACLEGLGMDYRELAKQILSKFAEEIESSLEASKKVRPVA